MNVGGLMAFLSDVLATFVVQVAYIIMKLAILEVEKSGMNGQKKKNIYCMKRYIIGFCLLFIGSVWHVVVLPFCDVVLLSTNTATGILMALWLSIKYLGEKPVYKYDIPSAVLIVTGCLLICVLSSYSDKTFTSEEIHTLLTRPSSIMFLCFFACLVAGFFLTWKWFTKGLNRFNSDLTLWMKKLEVDDNNVDTINSPEMVSLDSEGSGSIRSIEEANNVDASASIFQNNYAINGRRNSVDSDDARRRVLNSQSSQSSSNEKG